MQRKNRFLYISSILVVSAVFVLLVIIEMIMNKEGFSLRYLTKAQIYAPHTGQKQGSLGGFPSPIPTSTPRPTVATTGPTHTPFPPTNTLAPGQPTNTLAPNQPTVPPTQNPPAWSKQYCVDEDPNGVLIESCDDPTRCDVAHGNGGPSKTCGNVIGWEHAIIDSILSKKDPSKPYWNNLSQDLTQGMQSNCASIAPVSPYISTFNVIDAYRLAGFTEFSRATQASATALFSAWGSTAGYSILNTAQGVAPGDAMFFTNPAHVAMVNTVELDNRGDGSMWFLHTGGNYYLGKVIIAGWNVVASSTGDNAVKYGTAQPKGADATTGNTTCYCDGGIVCYSHTF